MADSPRSNLRRSNGAETNAEKEALASGSPEAYHALEI